MAEENLKSITATGTVFTVVASNTFPAGFEVDGFADDADPFDFSEQEIGEYGIGFNGTIVTWSKAVALPFTLNVIPNSNSDINLSILYNANRRTKDHKPADDVITITATYPDGTTKTLKNGKILSGVPVLSAAQNGRFKTRPYNFVFADAQ